MNLPQLRNIRTALAALLVFLVQLGTAFAQGDGAESPAGLEMLVLFLGIVGIGGVFVIRWSQSANDDEG